MRGFRFQRQGSDYIPARSSREIGIYIPVCGNFQGQSSETMPVYVVSPGVSYRDLQSSSRIIAHRESDRIGRRVRRSQSPYAGLSLVAQIQLSTLIVISGCVLDTLANERPKIQNTAFAGTRTRHFQTKRHYHSFV